MILVEVHCSLENIIYSFILSIIIILSVLACSTIPSFSTGLYTGLPKRRGLATHSHVGGDKKIVDGMLYGWQI